MISIFNWLLQLCKITINYWKALLLDYCNPDPQLCKKSINDKHFQLIIAIQIRRSSVYLPKASVASSGRKHSGCCSEPKSMPPENFPRNSRFYTIFFFQFKWQKNGKRGKEPVKNASKIKIYWFFFNNM